MTIYVLGVFLHGKSERAWSESQRERRRERVSSPNLGHWSHEEQ